MPAVALDAGELLTAEPEIVRRTVFLPAGGGLIEFDFSIAGPVGFLAAKVPALNQRDKAEDVYGLVLTDAGPGGPKTLAQTSLDGGGMSLPTAGMAERKIVTRLTITDDVHE